MKRFWLLPAIALLAMGVTTEALDADIIVSAEPFIAEGVAVAPGSRLIVSGVFGRTVLIDGRKGFTPWLRPGPFAPIGGLFGMEADRHRDRLWIAEVSGADVPGGTGPRRTAILEVRLRSGRVLARHIVDAEGKDRWLGDLALDGQGHVYASDSKGGGVYRLAGGALTKIAQLGFASPQGLVLTKDGKALILADYATGLHHIDLATGNDVLLDAGTAQLRGIDGLERDGASLIATQNGTVPNRVLRIRLGAGDRKIDGVDILVRQPERIDDVALGTVKDGRFVYVAHSQWSATGEDGRFTKTPSPARLASVALR